MAIYFVQADIGGPIKIGYAVDAAARIRILQTGCPFPLRVLSVVDGEPRDECALHERFAASRDHGEWFKPTSDLLAHLAGAGAVPDDVSPRFRLVMRAMRTHPEDAWDIAQRLGRSSSGVAATLAAMHRRGLVERHGGTLARDWRGEQILRPPFQWSRPPHGSAVEAPESTTAHQTAPVLQMDLARGRAKRTS